MLQWRAAISRLVSVDGVVPEESADRLSFPFPNQGFETLGVHADGAPVGQGPGAVKVTIHDSILHRRSESILHDTHLPRSKILPNPVRTVEIILPGGIARQVLYASVLEVRGVPEARYFFVVFGAKTKESPIFRFFLCPGVVEWNAVVSPVREVDFMLVPREVEDGPDFGAISQSQLLEILLISSRQFRIFKLH
jgi:hypothetical protein